MDAELKSRWVKALRSGEYRQAHCMLRDATGAMCCLGVLCSIQGTPDAMLNGVMKSIVPDEYAGGLARAMSEALARMNDGGKSFPEIADYIEEHL